MLLDTDYNWRVESAQGGILRAVGDIGSHWLDLAQFLTGQAVERVMADFATFIPVRQKPVHAIQTFSTADVERTPITMDTEDAAAVLLRLDGARAARCRFPKWPRAVRTIWLSRSTAHVALWPGMVSGRTSFGLVTATVLTKC